jgi:hypothetical protein
MLRFAGCNPRAGFMSPEPVSFEIRRLIGQRIRIGVCKEAEAGTDYEDGEGEVWMWIWMCLGVEG